MQPLRRIGLMGGTFDPIHYGHLFIAEEARVLLALDTVVFIPNLAPPHRQGKVASAAAEARYAMTQAAIAGNPQFEISRCELDRPGPSYAYDTLLHMRNVYGDECELHFIVGADSLEELPTWYRGGELLELCRFVAATRPGYNVEKALEGLTAGQRARVTVLHAPGLHIASSDLRERVAKGATIRYLVPECVEQIIVDRKLYRELAVGEAVEE